MTGPGPCDICGRPATWRDGGDSGEPEIAFCERHAPVPSGPQKGEALTDRELRLLMLYARGLTLAEVGEQEGYSRRTAKRLARHARVKLGAPTTHEAAIVALARGLVGADNGTYERIEAPEVEVD